MADKEFEELAKALNTNPFLIWLMQELDDCEVQMQEGITAGLGARYEALLEVRDKYCEATEG